MDTRDTVSVFCHFRKKSFRIHEIAISALGIATTISGLSRYPLVSSSKNLRRPALDAGSGADFLLLLMTALGDRFLHKNFCAATF